jgi:hypothetical protein
MLRQRLLYVSFAMVALIACGESLIKDPSFNLWCGNALCAPWEASGAVSRAPTWHRSDYGVQLGDDAMLSQLSTHDKVECIEFEVIADVVASAGVLLEMDFDDDGSAEYSQMIPENHWTKLTFTAHTQPGYKSVRFILRKTGHGRAVLAQIKAVEGFDCSGSVLPATHRPNGMACTGDAQCEGGACEERGDVLALDDHRKACGECGARKSCADDMRCGAALSEQGVYPACVPQEQDIGGLCASDEECASQHCVSTLSWATTTCGECARDEDCPPAQVCGSEVLNRRLVRVCRKPGQSALATLCAEDAECTSGICAKAVCSECDETRPCSDQSKCETYRNTTHYWPVVGAAACQGASTGRHSGEACYETTNCASHNCIPTEPVCALCEGEACPMPSPVKCPLYRQPPGTCR